MNSTWAEQAAWTRSQRQAASNCGALRMATTSQRSPKSKVGHAEFAKARSLPAFAEPLEPGLQEVTGGMMLQTALKGPRPAMLQSAESGASGRPPSSDTSRTSQSHLGTMEHHRACRWGHSFMSRLCAACLLQAPQQASTGMLSFLLHGGAAWLGKKAAASSQRQLFRS